MNNIANYRMMSMPYAQCHVEINSFNGVQITLYSYSTPVITVDDWGYVYCSGTYSSTTARHINRFTTELLGRSFYYECKAACKNKVERWAQVYSDGEKVRATPHDVAVFIAKYQINGKKWHC